ncbi:MAG TPA: discoidin domain-containing protein [Thermoanaerobaculia bacterium]|jgi:RHS repeat-associated protein
MKKTGTFLTSRSFGFGNLSARRGIAALLAYLVLLQPVALQAAELHAQRDAGQGSAAPLQALDFGPPPAAALTEAAAKADPSGAISSEAALPAVLPVVAAPQAVANQFAVVLTPVATAFNEHSGLDHHQPSGKLLAAASVAGAPNLEVIGADGSHRGFSNLAGLTGAIAIASVRASVAGGFAAGEVFTSTNTAGVINRVAADGSSFRTLSLPGETGLVTGLHVAGANGGAGAELLAVTSSGAVWRVNAAGVATRVANISAELTSITSIPNDAGRYGPLAGKLVAGAAGQPLLYALDSFGNIATIPTGIIAADVEVIPPHQNFYAVDSASRTILGAPDDAFAGLLGDILIAQSAPGVLARIRWDGTQFEVAPLGSAPRFDRVTFSPAGVAPLVAVKRVYDALAVVRHAPVLDSGRVEGSLWQLAAENVTLDGTDVITTDLLLPGTPQIVVGSGKPSFAGVIEGTENAQPSTHTFTIANNAVLRHVINRTDPIVLTPVAAPPAPAGTRDLTLTTEGAPLGDASTLRNLSISGKAGAVAVPPGTYGTFSATGRTAFLLGTAGATTVYNLQSLQLGGGSELRLAGPVIINTVTASLAGSTIGAASTPKNLILQATGAADVSGNAILYGIVRAPGSTITIDGNSRLRGTVTADRLHISGNGVLEITENDVPPPPVNRPPTVDAGGDQTTTLPNDTISLTGTVNDDGLPAGSTVASTWTMVSGPAAVTFADATKAATTVTFTTAGTYVLRLTANDSLLSTADETTITVIPRNQPPVVDAGTGQTVELPGAASLAGSVSDDGLPLGSTLHTTWIQKSGPGLTTFANAASLATTATFSAAGTYTLTLSATDGEATVTDDVVITVHPENQPPVVNAGADQFLVFPAPATLAGSATDDGWPSGSTLVTTWAQISGPGNATFADAGKPATTATFSVAGVYVLRLTATDGRASGSDDVTITIDPENEPPAVNAGTDQTLELPARATLTGSVMDDGWPRGSTLTSAWSQVSGPGTTSFAEATKPGTFASFSAAGTYVLRLTGTDGTATATDDVTITVDPLNEPPVVNAGPDQTLELPNGASLAGTIDDDGWPRGSTVTSTWTLVSGPGAVTFADATKAATIATFSTPGTYVVRLTATDSRETVSDEAIVTVHPQNQPPVVNAGPDQQFRLPLAAALAGTASDDGWPFGSTLVTTWSLVSGPGTVTFGSPADAVTTATFSTHGTYVLRLTANDSRETVADELTIVVLPANIAPVADAGEPQTATIGANLLTNGGNEEPLVNGQVANWIAVSGTWTRGGSFPFSTEGEQLFATADATAELTQDVDIRAFAPGQTFAFSGFVRTGEEPAFDAPRVVVEYRDATQTLASFDYTPTVALLDWTRIADTRVAPAGATSIRIRLIATRNSGSTTDVWFDGFDLRATGAAAVNLAGVVTDDGLPAGSTLTTIWTRVSGPGAVTFGNAATPATSASFTAPGTYVLRLTAHDGELRDASDVEITVGRANAPPAIDAGAKQEIRLPDTVTLHGTVDDDGLPAGSTLTLTWSAIVAGAPVVFSNVNAAASTATFTAPGTYVLRLTANDGAAMVHDEVTVVVKPANRAPHVNAGPDQSLTLPSNASLTGLVTDPEGDALTIGWTKASGPGVVTFAAANSAVTTASFSAAGTYVLRLTANDGELSDSDEVTIDVAAEPINQAPVVTAGADSFAQVGADVALNGSVTDDGLPPLATVTAAWSQVSGAGVATFTNPSAAGTTVTFDKPGVYVLRLTGSDTLLTASDDVRITVRSAPVASFTVAGPQRNLLTLDNNLASTQAGAQVVASSAITAGYPADNALDDSMTTRWRGATPADHWFIVQLAGTENAPRSFDRIRILNGLSAEAVRNFRIDVSTTTTDDAAFTTVFTGISGTIERIQEYRLSGAVSARYVRFRGIDTQGSTGVVSLRSFQVIGSRLSGFPTFLAPANIAAITENAIVIAQTAGNGSSAMDGLLSTLWVTSASRLTNQSFTIDLNTQHTIDRIRVHNLDDSLAPVQRAVKDFRFEVSNDNVTWTAVSSGVLQNAAGAQEFTFAPVAARFLRFVAVNNYGSTSALGIRELEVVSIYANKSSVSSYNALSALPENLFDNDANSGWITGNGRLTNEYVEFELGAEVTGPVTALALQGYTSAGSDLVKDFELLASNTTDDDGAFTSILTGTYQNAGTLQTFPLPGGPLRARYFRFVAKNNHGSSSYIRLGTLQLLGPVSDGNVLSAPGNSPAQPKNSSPAMLANGASVAAFSTGTPANMLDYLHSAPWSTTGPLANQYVKIQLGGTTLHTLTGVVLGQRSDTTSTTDSVKDFEVWVSTTTSDDAAFTRVLTAQMTASKAPQSFTFAPVQAKYVKYVPRTPIGTTTTMSTGYFDVILAQPAAGMYGASSTREARYNAQQALDNNGNTQWISATNAATDQYVDLALAAPMKLYGVTITPDFNGYPKDFEIRVSNTTTDASAFTTIYSGTLPQTTVAQQINFNRVAEARYVRFFFRNGYSAAAIAVAELGVRGLPEDGSALISYTSAASGFVPSSIIDVDLDSGIWQSATNQASNQQLTIALPATQSWIVDHVGVQQRVDCLSCYTAYTPRRFEVQVANDLEALEWRTVYTGGMRNIDTRMQHYWFPATQARFVRLRMIDNWGGTQLALSNFLVFSPQIGALAPSFVDNSVPGDSNITRWQWSFGDGGTSAERDPSHTYAEPGLYDVSLTVTDANGLTSTRTIPYAVEGSPRADFTMAPQPASEGSSITFTDTSSSAFGSIGAREWVWGDSSGNGQDAVAFPHTYTDNGTFNATLRITSARGVRGTVTKPVVVLNVAPTGTLGIDKAISWGDDWAIGFDVNDAGAVDRNALLCRIEFGDGQTQTIPNCRGNYPSHSFVNPGVYTATLTVTDKDGAATTDTAVFTVRQRPTVVSYSGGRGVLTGAPLTVGATLRDAGLHTQIAGKTITFTIEGQTATAVTNAEGYAEATIIYAGTSERPSIVAAFAGDARYAGSSVTVIAACPTDQNPLDISLVFDLSGSMLGDRLVAARNASLVFLDSLQRNQDQAAAVSFTSSGFLEQGLTYDLDAVREAIDEMNANGGTLVGAGINTARTELLGVRRNPYALPVMIIYSDFEDGDPTTTRAAATTAKNAGIRIISVMLGGNATSARQLGKDVASGPGDYYEAAQNGELTGIYASIISSICAPANKPPVVNSGSNQTIVFPANSVTLNGTVTDDGLPPLAALQISWSQENGPGTVTFGDVKKPATTATFSIPGTYVLRLTANDTQYTRSSSVTVTVYPQNGAPVVNAGPDQTIALPSIPSVPAFALKAISTTFNSPIGIDHHAPTNKVVISANYSNSGQPHNFELLAADGSHAKFSSVAGLTDELKIATARDDGNGMSRGGFPAGTLFSGTGTPGAILRVSADGQTVQNPWITLPGEPGLMRGSLYIDRTGVFGGDLIVVTTHGGVWRITSAGVPTRLASVGEHLEGMTVLPNDPRYGPWAGKIVAGAENSGRFWSIAPDGTTATYSLGITPEDIDIIPANENFFGVDFSGARVMGAPAAMFAEMVGDVLVAQEHPGILWHVRWNGTAFEKRELARVNQWEHVTFSPAAIAEVPQPSSTTVTLSGTATDDGNPFGSTLAVQWTSVTAPGTVAFNPANQPVTTATLSEAGTYVLRLTGTDGELTSTDDVTVVVKPGNRGPKVNAGPDQTTTLRGGNLAGSVTDDGLPSGTLTYSWAKLNGPGNVTFGDSTSLTSTASYSAFGTYTLRLTANDGEFTVSDEVTVIVDKTPGNIAPAVNAGADATITDPVNTTALNGSVTDDGIPSGVTVTRSWTQVSGPAAANFADATAASTNVSFTAYGVYVLRLTANDTELTSTDDVVVTYRKTPENLAPVVDAGADATTSTSTTTLSGTATDDGLPTGSAVAVTWSKVSGPGNVTFSNAASRTTTATFTAYGIYVLRLTASDSELAASDTVTIRYEGVNQAPVVSAGADRVAVVNKPATLSGTIADDNLPLGGTLSVQWTKVSGPGTVTFGSPSSALTTALFSDLGTYVLRLTANDSALGASDDVTITVQATLPPPTAEITSPISGSTITERTVFTGTVSEGANWRLEYRLNANDEAAGTNPWTTISSGTGPTNGTLGTFDPTVLINGTYKVRLVATDAADQTTAVSVSAVVEGDLKVGFFSVAFQDLQIPLPGLPISVTRTYDSRDTRLGDFGHGWRLSLSDVRVEKSGTLGSGWEETVSNDRFPNYCLVAAVPRYITFTFPDGKVHRFRLAVSPACQVIVPIQTPTVSFEAVGDTRSKLVALGDNDVMTDGPIPGPQNLITADVEVYDPTRFRLTTEDGIVFEIDEKDGVKSITDRNGNKLTIGRNGVTHSAGRSVTFVRDALGRITSITDAAGKTLTYTYDGRGDLTKFTDQTLRATTFTYNNSHGLLDYFDSMGRRGVRSEYDASGRLIGLTDADGNTQSFNFDPDSRVEVTTNRRGKTIVYQYDKLGKILSVTDADGKARSATYDGKGNMLTSTDKLGQVTTYTYDTRGNVLTKKDAENRVTTYTYNTFNQITSITDANDQKTSYDYDAVTGKLKSMTAPDGRQMHFTYTPLGNMETLTDAKNNVRRNEYDTAGNLSKEIDTRGKVTSYTYDNMNRVLTVTDPNNQKTTYGYDNAGRLTTKTDHLNNTETTEYDAAGMVSAVIDSRGNRTSVASNAQGLPTSAKLPDDAEIALEYDPEDTVTRVTRTGGFVTYVELDDVGQEKKFVLAPGIEYTYELDAEGRRKSVTDPRGYKTSFTWNALNKRTSITDALSNKTLLEYDGVGNLESITDANQHTISFVWDGLERLKQKTLPNGKSIVYGHDEVGNLTSVTDPRNHATAYGWTGEGMLARVTEANGVVTSFGYDDNANRTTVTNGKQQTVTYKFDELNRITQRTYADGSSESFTYKGATVVETSTDREGRKTTFSYDSRNRISRIDRADGTSIWYTYTADGRPDLITDARGVTDYDYDVRGNVTRVKQADGTVITYTYDKSGNRETMVTPDGTTTFVYDEVNRLSKVTDPHGHATSYSYDKVGNVTKIVYPNGVTTTKTYNVLNLVETIVTVNSAGTTILAETYGYDESGNRTSVQSQDGASMLFAYDALARLDVETHRAANGTVTRKVDYDYDETGNRKSVTDLLTGTTTPYSYNELDQLTSDGLKAYTYDRSGNIKTAGAATEYSYDVQKQLTGVTLAGGHTVTYGYDAQGQRVRSADNGVVREYVLDMTARAAQVVLERDEAKNVVAAYTYGHELISAERADREVFYLYDGLGSVRALTDASGNVTDTVAYDAFGQITSRTGLTPNDYFYRGERLDRSTGLYHLRAREYDPSLGRFIQIDSYHGTENNPQTFNRYIYALNNPASRIDPSGHVSLSDGNKAHGSIGRFYLSLMGQWPDDGWAVVDGWIPKGDWGAGVGKKRGGLGTRPDLREYFDGDVYEIKPLTPDGLARVHGECLAYVIALNIVMNEDSGLRRGPETGGWNMGDWSFRDPSPNEVDGMWVKGHSWFGPGAVIYSRVGQKELMELEPEAMAAAAAALAAALAAQAMQNMGPIAIPRPVTAGAQMMARAVWLLGRAPGMIMRAAIAGVEWVVGMFALRSSTPGLALAP